MYTQCEMATAPNERSLWQTLSNFKLVKVVWLLPNLINVVLGGVHVLGLSLEMPTQMEIAFQMMPDALGLKLTISSCETIFFNQ